MVITKSYTEPSICKKEILRYAGCKDSTDESLQFLLEECLEEVIPKLTYKVCYVELPLTIADELCDFECMQVKSKDLGRNLQGCEKVLLFAATIGVEIDRLIMKYGKIAPTKAVLLQAIGAERIESLCDAFCQEVQAELGVSKGSAVCLRPRFSPGYGDLPLETQKDIFQVLNCSKNIGLSLNDSLLMSPSKSVSAFVGIGIGTERKTGNKCMACKNTDCEYRGV